MGAANQFRTMGSAFGLAITTSVFNGYTASHLRQLGLANAGSGLSPAQILNLPAEMQVDVRTTLSEGYNRQMIVLAALSAAQFPAAVLMWRKKQTVTV